MFEMCNDLTLGCSAGDVGPFYEDVTVVTYAWRVYTLLCFFVHCSGYQSPGKHFSTGCEGKPVTISRAGVYELKKPGPSYISARRFFMELAQKGVDIGQSGLRALETMAT